ncbi:MAG: hypothetical protein WB586_25240 [Chthoniobacterales bacterium]
MKKGFNRQVRLSPVETSSPWSDPAGLVASVAGLERTVLAQAVRWRLEHRVAAGFSAKLTVDQGIW